MQRTLGILALAAFATSAVSQCVNPSGTSYGGGDDVVVNGGAGIALGFPFPVGGVTYDYIHPSTNGFVYLSDGTPSLTNADFTPTVGEMYGNEPRVAPLWTDLNLTAANAGEVFVDLSVAGQCTITWANAIPWNTASAPFSVQCTMTATGDVSFSYDSGVWNNGVAIAGISPGLGAGTPPPSLDFSSMVPTANEMAHEEFAASTFDLAASTLQLIPTLPGYVPIVTSGTCATVTTYGAGCVGSKDAVHELFANGGAIDICQTGTAITFLRTGNGYTILDSIPGAYVAPSAAATVVASGDDAFGLVTLSSPMPVPGGVTSDLQVCTNGFIGLSLNQPGAPDYSPSVAEFLAFSEPVICGPWYDWSPNQGGQLVAEEISGILYITWDAVTPYNGTGTDTFQFQFELATGSCTIVFENMSFSGGSGWHTPLFGYTAGNAAFPDAVDMSNELPAGLMVGDVGAQALELNSNPPVIGGNWDLTSVGVDPISPVAITVFSSAAANPGVPMSVAGFNAPGCSIYISNVLASVASPNVGGTSTATIPVPNNQALVGYTLAAQSLSLTLQTPANLLTSNGLEGVLGN